MSTDLTPFSMVPEDLIYSVSPRALQVWCALHRFADSETYTAWPSYTTIAAKLGVTWETISEAVQELVKSGRLEIVKRKGKSNLFRFHLTRREGVGNFRGVGSSRGSEISGGSEKTGGEGSEIFYPNENQEREPRTTRVAASATHLRALPSSAEKNWLDDVDQNFQTNATVTQVIPFDKLWMVFPLSRRGGKKESLKLWNKFTADEKRAAVDGAEIYRQFIAELQQKQPAELKFFPKLTKWLQDRCFEIPIETWRAQVKQKGQPLTIGVHSRRTA